MTAAAVSAEEVSNPRMIGLIEPTDMMFRMPMDSYDEYEIGGTCESVAARQHDPRMNHSLEGRDEKR